MSQNEIETNIIESNFIDTVYFGHKFLIQNPIDMILWLIGKISNIFTTFMLTTYPISIGFKETNSIKK